MAKYVVTYLRARWNVSGVGMVEHGEIIVDNYAPGTIRQVAKDLAREGLVCDAGTDSECVIMPGAILRVRRGRD